jgi:hypothetical protein
MQQKNKISCVSFVTGASQWIQATLSNPNEAARSPLTVWLGRFLEPVPR